MTWLKKHLFSLLLFTALFIGLALILYPSLSDYWNSFHQTRAIMQYSAEVANMDTSEYEEIIEHARQYNYRISQEGINWILTDEERELYNSELNYTGSGIMGYINIEKIHVMLPLYHGTSEAVLQTSIGHLEGTSLPVGAASWDSRATKSGGAVTDLNEGSHCVLSGHRGLPSAKLFSDLDKLVDGDTFSLNIMDETLTYQVDQIRVVEPTNLSDLQIVPGKDYCTLVTCTPYGINTHRLLVRAHRVDNPQGDIKVVADALQIEPVYIVPIVAAPMLVLLLILTIVVTDFKKKHKRPQNFDELL